MNTNDVERNPGAGDAPPPALGDPWSFQRSLRRFDLPVACLSLLLWAAPVHADTSAYTDRSLNPRSIMRLTMDYSARIEAAKHQLKSAESNYQLFESEFTQFTPLRFNSEIEGDKSKDYESEISVGMAKEFFNGGAVSADVGNSDFWGKDSPDENKQFVRTEVQFPLFSSNRKLTRIINRTFEENELHNAHLDYVNTIRETIRNALETYYDYVPRAKILQGFRHHRHILTELNSSSSLGNRPIARQQIEGEINSLTSTIQGWEIEVRSLLIEMQRWMGTTAFADYEVEPIDIEFGEEDYFGEYYITAPHDEILRKAIQNDTELRVLELIKENALEKKRLAERGKWDIFLSLEGQYDFRDEIGNADNAPDYTVLTGLSIERFDRSVLYNTIQKAVADVRYVESTMEDRRLETESEITQKKAVLLTRKQQVLSSRKSLQSWQQIHDSKLEKLKGGTETVDNYIQAFRSLTDTMEESLDHENGYLDTIRDFDFICGEYFKFLGIKAY